MDSEKTGVVVTGSAGFVGRALVREIRQRYPSIDILEVDLKTGLDLREASTLAAIEAYQPATLFHLAAHHFIPWCSKFPRQTLELNAVITRDLLDAANADQNVIASSAAVYGLANDVETIFAEGDGYKPVDVYGESKVWAELALHSFATRSRTGCIAARLFNVVGPEGEDAVPHLHPKVMAASGREMRASLPGLEERRDYVHVDDVAQSLVDLGELIERPGFMSVNISTGLSISGFEMCDFYGVTPVDDAALHRPAKGHLRGSTDLLTRITGRAPASPWERLLNA